MAKRDPIRRRPVAEATLRRLPVYYQLLRQMQAGGIPWVSCSLLGRELSLDATQIRKDLEVTGVTGKPKVGYEVTSLVCAIEDFLGWTHPKEAFLAGAGTVGQAPLSQEP